MAYKRKDGIFAEPNEGYARSIYKLEAIDQRFKLLRKRSRADLGCLRFLAAVSHQGRRSRRLVVGVDLQPIRIELPSYAASCSETSLISLEDYSPTGDQFHVIVSDMAPPTGIET